MFSYFLGRIVYKWCFKVFSVFLMCMIDVLYKEKKKGKIFIYVKFFDNNLRFLVEIIEIYVER